ncbi:hypothetical protein CsatA_007828 [Cannabis sativa]
METQRFCPSNHIMLLKDDKKTSNNVCEMCVVSFSDADDPYYYVCDSCDYYVHKSCEKLPKQINYHFHPQHPLFLKPRFKSFCHSCGQLPKKYLMFSCDECDFYMDVECTQMSTNSISTCPNEGQHCIQHSTHPHLLLLFDTSTTDMNVSCFACQSSDDIGVYYGCIVCKYFLHKQCIDQSPQQIQFFHHPNNHTHLSLHMKWHNSKCNVCGYSKPALYYDCPHNCNFQLCFKCGLRRQRTISYEYHPHILCFLDKIHTTYDQCNVYDNCLKQLVVKSDSNEFHKTDSSIFGCLDCDFKLHLLCGPLPSVIKHESHMHSLNLVDSCIDDTFGDYYCDICEEERNPRLRVYYCAKCKYVAHVHCVISEVINILKGDIRDVKLKVLGEDVWEFPNKEINYPTLQLHPTSSLNTLEDLIHKLTRRDLDRLKDHFFWDEERNKTIEVESQEDEVLKLSSFTESDFMHYIFKESQFIYFRKKLGIKSSDLALKIVGIKGYFIPFNLASVMKYLLHKYEDISNKYYSKEFNSIGYYFVCKVMKEMHTTLVADITKNLLQQWYHYLLFASIDARFEVDFLWQFLWKITREFYYQQLRKLVEIEFPMKIEKKILELQKKIDEYHAGLDKCKKLRESLNSTEESMVKQGLEKAVEHKWKLATQF